MYKEEGDKVKKGEILAEIDPTDYLLQLQKIKDNIKSLEYKKQSLEEKKNRIKQEIEKNIKIAQISLKENGELKKSVEAQIQGIEANLSQLERDKKRYEILVQKDLAPKIKLENIETNIKVLASQKNSLLSKLQQIETQKKSLKENLQLAKIKKLQVEELKKEIESLNEQIKSLQKSEKDVENLISYTKLKAPFDGVIAKKFKSIGEIVASGIPVYSMYPTNDVYINVLLEETKLKGVKVGNKAIIHIDAYPDEHFEGVVYEISPASAATFALIPRDVTAGEFTKVAQRIPVKIKITKGKIELLKVGMGGEVEIERK
jgi:membrane fusion protein (multidrug efflux system)